MPGRRCIEHTIHLMASHFVAALGIKGLGKTKKKLHGGSSGTDRPTVEAGETASGDELEDFDEFNEEFDVDTNMDIEASAEDNEAMRDALLTTFDAGDVIGKLMAFIAQLRCSNEGTGEYLAQICTSLGCVSLEIKLWVRTRWGSLSNCFVVLPMMTTTFLPSQVEKSGLITSYRRMNGK
jgi:hypothetical protein